MKVICKSTGVICDAIKVTKDTLKFPREILDLLNELDEKYEDRCYSDRVDVIKGKKYPNDGTGFLPLEEEDVICVRYEDDAFVLEIDDFLIITYSGKICKAWSTFFHDLYDILDTI